MDAAEFLLERSLLRRAGRLARVIPWGSAPAATAAERSLLGCRRRSPTFQPTFSHLICPARRNILAPAGKIILE
jgi:hypothetical protein